MPKLLSRSDFKTVVQLAPLVSIDLIIRDPEGKVLLGRRNNEPAKGSYFVPGGRILKDERIQDAFARILKTEVDCEAAFVDARFLGAFEHFYETNFANEPGFGTHYVTLAYELNVTDVASVRTDPQHSDYSWWHNRDLLRSDRVHENTKIFFRPRSLDAQTLSDRTIPKLLNRSDFKTVVQLTPLVSIDLIIRDPDDKVLLGRRNNEPAKGSYFVPGGCILKNERIQDAFARILKTEVNYAASFAAARFLGVFEHFYDSNFANEPGFGTHYVALAYEIKVTDVAKMRPDPQHSDYSWWDEADLIASEEVHENAKISFTAARSACRRMPANANS